mgnify:CR=1 FL=1
MVTDRQTGQTLRFLLETGHRRNAKDSSFLEEMVKIENKDGHVVAPCVIEQEIFNDLILKGMYESVKKREEKEIIPCTVPGIQSYELLLEMGLVAEEGSGQIMLPLSR